MNWLKEILVGVLRVGAFVLMVVCLGKCFHSDKDKSDGEIETRMDYYNDAEEYNIP